MFSHTINNPNNVVIKQNNKDYCVIPFGHRCATALACKYANIRLDSLPFDWGAFWFPNIIQKVLENNFDNFNNFESHNNVIINKTYGVSFGHFNVNFNDGIEEYTRRINRFNDIIIKPTTKYFVYLNEDYINKEQFRLDEFNDKIFDEMLELESFIKEKYINIDYNILYFNFKHHNIPANSNIINIVLHSDTFYEPNEVAPYENLRNYCGQILSELFNTELTLGYHYTDFNK